MPFRTALSGLNAASAELRVIGHNVANAGTTGFKKARAEFADIFASSNLGTTQNAIGSGVRTSSVAQQFSQGNINFTDNNLDLAINGQGFFVVDDSGNNVFTRNGTFSVDRTGYVVNNQGQRLQAFQADTNGNITGAQGDLFLDTSDIAPQATGLVTLGLNLDASDAVAAGPFDAQNANTYNDSTSLTVYDSLGTSHLLTMYYRKTAANTWETYAYLDGNAPANQVDGPDTLAFNNLGQITTPASPYQITIPAFAPGGGAANMNVTLDYADATQYGSSFSVFNLVQDGFTTGRLSGVDIGETGVVQASFSNGQTQTLGQVALANFNNPQGLRQLGDTTWSESFDSGAALIGPPGTGNLGLIQSGALEGSNVDLTEQLITMITAQRNFQANSQVISTADTITQTIINIR
jgi:flagellar hook protein FlgE